jgi:acyl-coenzyme A thioesterase PaaI-like protein
LSITHHEGCFGCGLANLFGLQMELESTGGGEVRGRFFVKQDHQGPPGIAHGGVVGAALDEAMALLLHDQGVAAVTARLEIDLSRPAPVGEFVEVSARIAAREGRRIELEAVAAGEAGDLARARGVFAEIEGFGG